MDKLVNWIHAELNKRGWKAADLAHRAGVSTGAVSNILKKHRRAGPDFCNGVAWAFGEPPEKVFRLAGLLPELPAPEEMLLTEVTETFKYLSIEKRHEVLEYALWHLRRQQQEREEHHRRSGDATAAKGPI